MGLNGKVRCTKQSVSGVMLRGKVYEFKNGNFIKEDGRTSLTYKSIEHFNSTLKTQIEAYEEMDEFKLGDEVWDIRHGRGVIVGTSRLNGDSYPIGVVFEVGKYVYFTADGRSFDHEKRTLFFEELIIPSSAYKRKERRLHYDKDFYNR